MKIEKEIIWKQVTCRGCGAVYELWSKDGKEDNTELLILIECPICRGDQY